MSLVTYLPFNEKQKELNFNNNKVDYSIWKLNTQGSQGGWSTNGGTDENKIMKKENPMDELDIVWATEYNNIDYGADGGFHSDYADIDPTKTYRFSTWIRRENVLPRITGRDAGTTYFGMYGYNELGTSIGCEYGYSYKSSHNVYFRTVEDAYYRDGTYPQDEWLLWVAYINPTGTEFPLLNQKNSGIYKKDGTKLNSISDYFRFLPETKQIRIRSYLYYSTQQDERSYWYRPRVDLYDGNEPSVDDLLNLREAECVYDKTDVDKSYNVETVEYNINREDYGKIGSCISADSTNGYIELKKINNSLSWSNVFENNFTVACWIKINNIHETTDNSVFGYGVGGANKFLHLNIRRKRAFFGFYGNDYTNIDYLWEDNDWHHIAFVGDKDNMKQRIYIDGIEIGNRPVVSWLNFLGNEYTPKILKYSTNSLDGCMNDFRIYDEALSSDKVSELSKGLQINYNFNSLERAYQSNNGFILDSNTPNNTDGYLKWTGDGQYIKSELPVLGNELTFNLWYKSADTSYGNYPLLTIDNHIEKHNQLWIGVMDNKFTDVYVTDGNWHMMTVYIKTHPTDYTQRIMKTYCDGILTGDINYSQEGEDCLFDFYNNHHIWIGYDNYDNEHWINNLQNSRIEGVKVCSKELTQEDINKLYEGGI